jgi:hypothetical protein
MPQGKDYPMGRGKVGILILIIVSVVAVTAIGFYEVFFPDTSASQYQDRVQQAASRLEKKLKTLEDTTTLSLIDDPTAPTNIKQANVRAIKATIHDVQTDIAKLHDASKALQRSPYTGFTNQYKKAEALQEKTQASITQIQDAVGEYAKLVTFLEFYANIQDHLKKEIDNFNKEIDLNIYAGRGNAVHAIAAKIRQDGAALEKQPIPHELTNFRSTLLAFHLRAATAFDNLAGGLDAASDFLIYNAAGDIEAVGRELDTGLQTTYETSIQTSRVIKDIREISEKLEPIKEA